MTEKSRGHSRAKIYICAFLIPFIMVQIFWIICGMYPYGSGSILTGDMDVEFVNFYSYFINTMRSKNDWSYMLAKTLGGDFPGLAAFQLHDPLLFLLFLFPGDRIVAGIEFVFSLQIAIAGLSASVLLNNRYKASWMSLLFSTGYAFSAFFFGYMVLTIYFGALAVLPLVLYLFLRFAEEGKCRISFILSACYYIFVNYHMGFMLVIFLAALYFTRLINDKNLIKRLPHIIIAGVTILLIDGFFLIRTGLSLLGEKTTEGADYGFYRRFPMNQLFAGMFSGTARNDLRPLIYCSVAALFFAIVYFLSKKISIREKIANLLLMAFVAVSMWINTFDAVWHGFNNPEGFYWRYAYYISIIVIAIGYKGFVSYVYGETEDVGIENSDATGEAGIGGKKIIWISALVICLYMAWLMIAGNPYLDVTRLVINAMLIAVIVAASLLLSGQGKIRTGAFLVLMTVSVFEMLYSAKTSYVCLNSYGGTFPEISKFKDDYRDISDVISYIKSEDGGFYRIEKDFDRAINDPAMFDYIGLSHDSSCEKDEILDWLTNFGFCKTVYFTYYNGGSTAFVDDLFGIRYYVSRFDSIEKPYAPMSYNGTYHAYKNEDALPMAYIAPPGFKDDDISAGNTFEKQNRLVSYWSDDPVYIKAEPEITLDGAEEEGTGRYVRTAEEGFIVYNIPITEKMPLYFYFYAPHRQEGEVFVNGVSNDVYFTVNHWNVLCAGTYEPGDNVEIRMQIKADELEVSEACFYYEDPNALKKWGQAAAALNSSVGEIQEITSSHLMFKTDADKTSAVVVSIPHEPAWTVTCDGTKISTGAAIGELMCFEVPKGSHTIEMKYTPEGTRAGAATSCAGIILFILSNFWYTKKRKNTSGEE